MSTKQKSVVGSETIQVGGNNYAYTVQKHNDQYRAKFELAGAAIITRWRLRRTDVKNDVVKEIWIQAKAAEQHANELRKLADWNAGRPIFGGGGDE